MKRDLLRVIPVLFLLFPFLFLISHFRLASHPDWAEIAWAAGNTFWQAAGSATFSILLGFWGALGLLSFSSEVRRPWRAILEILLLGPNFLPVLFTLLAVLNIVDPFPMGLRGIILVHTLINWGLVAVLIAGTLEEKVGGLAELSLVEGASRWAFLRALVPILKRDLLFLWLFVFSVCFGGFAVPLMVGGSRGTTLEVLIYEKIRLSGDWGQAVLIAALQSVFLFALSWVASLGRASTRERRACLQIIATKSGVVLIVVITALLLLGSLEGLVAGWAQRAELRGLGIDLLGAAAGSLVMGLGTGFFCFAFLMGVAALVPRPWFERLLSGFVAPSSALTGFAFLVMTPNESFWPYLKIPLAVSLILLPSLWRMRWAGALEGLRRQHEVAETLGGRDFVYWRDVVVPQVANSAGTLAGLAAVWACGDFALSRILAHRDLTLGMIIETLVSGGYRLGLATLLSPLLAVVSLFCFLAMKGMARVLSRKSLS